MVLSAHLGGGGALQQRLVGGGGGGGQGALAEVLRQARSLAGALQCLPREAAQVTARLREQGSG